MKKIYPVLYGILIGLLATGAILLIAQRNEGVPITLIPAPTSTHTAIPKPTPTRSPIIVQIGGQIVNPGIYSMGTEDRLGDLISAAGGLTDLADNARVNAAAFLQDGDYFYIPRLDEEIPGTANNSFTSIQNSRGIQINFPIDLNLATAEDLEALPGIGPSKAEDIISHREQIGSFSSIEDLLEVPGVGEKTLESLKDLIFVEP